MIPFYENKDVPCMAVCGRNITFPPHMHRHVEIMYLQSGSLWVNTGNHQIELSEGDLFFALPNDIHSYETPKASQYTMLLFDLDLCGDYMGLLTGGKLLSPYLSAGDIHPDIPYMINAIAHESPDFANQVLLKGYISILLSRILESLSVSREYAMVKYDLIHRILTYITENFREHLTAESVARQFGVSKYHLSHIFSQKVHCGFNQYINTLRVEFSRHLLRDGTVPITQIAFDCGFESQRTFNRVFVQTCGISPREYRKKEEMSASAS